MKTYVIYPGAMPPLEVHALSRGLAGYRCWRLLCEQGYQITLTEFLEQARILRRH